MSSLTTLHLRPVACTFAACLSVPLTVAGAPPADEECWIVGDVASQISRLASLASGEEPGAASADRAGDGRLEVTVGGAGAAVGVQVHDHIWAPENFVPVAKALLPDASPAEGGEADVLSGGSAPATVLTTPTTENFLSVNRALSDQLSKSPRSPGLHRQAAFLLGAFALGENSGHFHDTRSALNRMVAHLAFANALDPEPGTGTAEEKLVPVLLEALVGREQAAVARLEELGEVSGAEAAWKRALDLHVRMDWRPYRDMPPSSLLERLALFRAYFWAVGSDQAIQQLQAWEGDIEPVPDWARIVLVYIPGAGAGQFCSQFTGIELVDAAEAVGVDLEEFEPGPLAGLGEALSAAAAEPGGDTSDEPFEVITRRDWSLHSQRHLMQHALRLLDWMRRVLGAPDSAAEFESALAPLYTKLTLFPLLAFEAWNLDAAGLDSSLAAARSLAKSNPELVPVRRWTALDGALDQPVADPSSAGWFAHLAPSGTTYNIYNRRKLSGDRLGGPALAAARALAPHHPSLLGYRASEIAGSRAADAAAQLETELGAAAAFHFPVALAAAEAVGDDPARYVPALRRAAAISPTVNFQLGAYFLDQKKTAEAMGAFQALVDGGAAAVRASKVCDLLVGFYLDNGQPEEAKAAAEFAAEVYSAGGLDCMIDYCLLTGDIDGAVEWAGKYEERYGRRTPLMRVCFESDAVAQQHQQEFDAFVAGLFPEGLRKVELASFSGAPESGVVIAESSPTLEAYGLAPGDVVVAVQGVRVHDFDQYSFARNLEPGLSFTVIVWDRETYREVEAVCFERRFGVNMEAYRN